MDRQDHEDFFEFIDYVEYVLDHVRVSKRYLRDVDNPLDFYNENEFRCRYRFSKTIVVEVLLPLVMNNLMRANNRGLPISPFTQLLTCLRYYATGNFQTVSENLRGISQQSVSLIIERVSVEICKHLPKYIKLPNSQEQKRQNVRLYQAKAGLSGVSACIGCTHIKIDNPGGDYAEVFRNRKGVFSLTVQVAVGPQMEMLDIVVRHPGSTHKSVIFDRSSLRVFYERGEMGGCLLGDNGYPYRSYLLTPVKNPGNENEERYNRAHKRTRNIVEQVFDLYKRRFPCLYKGLTTKIETSQAIICATAVLYNIGVKCKDNFIFEEELSDME